MADVYRDDSSTLRSVFPNSRLGSLAGMESQLPGPLDADSDPDAGAATTVGYDPYDEDWWANAIEVDTFDSPLAFDASENGLWNGHFVPPPPRPPFLDESVAADGLTTCDLCTWAWQRNAYSLDGSIGEYRALIPSLTIFAVLPLPLFLFLSFFN